MATVYRRVGRSSGRSEERKRLPIVPQNGIKILVPPRLAAAAGPPPDRSDAHDCELSDPFPAPFLVIKGWYRTTGW